MKDLASASREELLEVIAAQQAQNALLVARVAQLEEELRRFRKDGKREAPAWVKPHSPKKEKQGRKPRAQGFGRRREEPDEIREHALEQCPKCGRKLSGGWRHRGHQVIEIVLPQVRVIEHVAVGRWCGVCQERRLPTLAASTLGVQGRRRFGASVQGLVATRHGAFRVPINQIRRLLSELWGLRISDGEIVALLDGVAEAGRPAEQAIQEAVRGSPVVCLDETGWRQNGQNGWLWTFATAKLRYFLFRKTRSGRVAEAALGAEFKGKAVCDCYAGYNRLPNDRQRCWSHLLRDLHALKEKCAAAPEAPEVIAWAERIKALYEEAKAFASPNRLWRRRKRAQLEAQLEALAAPILHQPKAPHRVLAQRIIRHLGELFLFVEYPEVAADNNLAERSLRPAVIARKISGGTRSDKGSETKMRLLSLMGTWTAQDRTLLSSCRALLLNRSPA